MNKSTKPVTLKVLAKKIEQHEELIAQLVEIIGATNQNVWQVLKRQQNYQPTKDMKLLITSNKSKHLG